MHVCKPKTFFHIVFLKNISGQSAEVVFCRSEVLMSNTELHRFLLSSGILADGSTNDRMENLSDLLSAAALEVFFTHSKKFTMGSVFIK